MIKNTEGKMTAEYIYKFVKACEAVYGTRDPELILRERKATIKYGVPDGLRGMIGAVKGKVYVAIGTDMPESMKRITLAHLLGHAVLHRKRIFSGKIYEEPSDDSLYGAAEREADVFAAELLVTDEDILTLRNSGMSEGQIVSSFGTMREVVMHKLFSMRARGIPVGDETYRADFLKKCDIELFF